MAADPSEPTQDSERAIESRPYGIDQDEIRRACLEQMRQCIRQASDELVGDIGYRIIEVSPSRLRSDAAAGILWGYSLPVERLEEVLSDLQNAVVDNSMTAQEAVARAHKAVLEAVLELRYGARLRRKYFAPRPLPPAAELGRVCAIVERLAYELASLGDRCGYGSSWQRESTIHIHVHSDQ